MEVYIGIDYSMTSPAMTIKNSTHTMMMALSKNDKLVKSELEGNFLDGTGFMVAFRPYPEYETSVERFNSIGDIFSETIGFYRDMYPLHKINIAMEGYSYGSSSSSTVEIGENGGVLKNKLFKRYNLVPEIIAPTSLKKHATGNGKAEKKDMHQSFLELTGIDLSNELKRSMNTSPVSDLVDSFWIAHWIQDQYMNSNESKSNLEEI